MNPDDTTTSVSVTDPEFPLWGHVASVAGQAGAPFDKVADGLSAAFLAVIDPLSTHDLTDTFVSMVEAVISAVTGRDAQLPADLSCELNAVLQVGIERMLEEQ